MTELAEQPIAGEVSPTSWDAPDDLPFEAWVAAGQRMVEINIATRWWIGDWLIFGEAAYGEKYAQAMDVTKLDYQTLANYRWVAGKIPPEARRPDLSWTHHKEVATLAEKARDLMLEAAVKEHLTSRELRDRVKEPKGIQPPPHQDPTPEEAFEGGVKWALEAAQIDPNTMDDLGEYADWLEDWRDHA